MNENIIKDIPSYEGLYGITQNGQVWSYCKNKFMKNKISKRGVSIGLRKNGINKYYSIGKLVYTTWNNLSLEDLNDFNIIHLDKNIQNNNLFNLQKQQVKNFKLNEEVKDIPEYEGLYAATKTGKIWSYINNAFLTPVKKKNNAMVVTLTKDGKNYYCSVHRLIMKAWQPCIDANLLEVNHKDEDRTNNNLDNLEWCTKTYNINYGTRNERSGNTKKKKVRCIETQQIFDSQNDVAVFLNQKSAANISSCLHGRQKTCGGFHWEWVQKEGED